MNETMIIWMAVIAAVLLAFVLRGIQKFRETAHDGKTARFLEYAKDKEIFYCPGDEEN